MSEILFNEFFIFHVTLCNVCIKKLINPNSLNYLGLFKVDINIYLFLLFLEYMDGLTSYKILDQLFSLSDSHLCNGDDSIYPVKIVKWIK